MILSHNLIADHFLLLLLWYFIGGCIYNCRGLVPTSQRKTAVAGVLTGHYLYWSSNNFKCTLVG